MPYGIYQSDNFGSLVEAMPNGCLEWRGATDKDRYGFYKGIRVHRLSYGLSKGDPAGASVCHSCDNPLCLNPEHLFLGDAKANAVDCSLKRRVNNQYGGQAIKHCKNGHEYTPENTYWRPGTILGRDCRACIRARVKQYKTRAA